MTARLYLAPDSYGDPTIWRDTGHDRDEAVLTRTGGNAAGFDALAALVAAQVVTPCAGSFICEASPHEHGCFADDKGDCNYPDEHALTDGATR